MMTEVVFLPLKSAGGAILGHARIAGGICKLRLRRAVHGQAVVMGEDGTWFGSTEEEIGVRGRLCAVAVLEDGRLLCCGAPQGQRLDFADLQRQLERGQTKPQKSAKREQPPMRKAEEEAAPIPPREAAVPQQIPPREAAVPQQVPPTAQEAPAAMPETAPAVQEQPKRILRTAKRPKRSKPAAAAMPTPTGPAITDDDPPIAARVFAPIQKDSEVQSEQAAKQTPPIMEAPVFAEKGPFIPQPAADVLGDAPNLEAFAASVPAEAIAAPWESSANAIDPTDTIRLFDRADDGVPSLADSTADSEAFAALMRRAELVFESIEAPQPPLIRGSAWNTPLQEETQRTVRTAAGSAAQRSWGQEVELLLGERPAQKRTAIENPFPHIFPNAAFYSIGGSGVQQHLEGDWQNGHEKLRIYAVPGNYSPQPPAHLKGYTRFIRTLQGSYWVRVTGEG